MLWYGRQSRRKQRAADRTGPTQRILQCARHGHQIFNDIVDGALLLRSQFCFCQPPLSRHRLSVIIGHLLRCRPTILFIIIVYCFHIQLGVCLFYSGAYLGSISNKITTCLGIFSLIHKDIMCQFSFVVFIIINKTYFRETCGVQGVNE